MNKTDLLNSIQEIIRTEESASAIFLEHLHALTERAGFEEILAGKARGVLEHLIKENKRHQSILEALQQQIKGDERHDW